MSAFSYAVKDSFTMFRRKLRHAWRYPGMFLGTVVVPAGMLLLFVFAFGGTLGNGLEGSGEESEYINYISPGIVMLAVSFSAMGTSMGVAIDMTKGIINRFRTMDIARAALLTGHVLGSVIQTMISVLLVFVVALVAGFRPSASLGGWLAVLGLVALFSFAITWIAVALGLMARSPTNASNTPMIFQLLSFLSSAFVPAASMATGLRWFAEYQPFTPVTETLRGLLLGTPIGNDWIIAIAWCLSIAFIGYLWSKWLIKRDPRTTP